MSEDNQKQKERVSEDKTTATVAAINAQDTSRAIAAENEPRSARSLWQDQESPTKRQLGSILNSKPSMTAFLKDSEKENSNDPK